RHDAAVRRLLGDGLRRLRRGPPARRRPRGAGGAAPALPGAGARVPVRRRLRPLGAADHRPLRGLSAGRSTRPPAMLRAHSQATGSKEVGMGMDFKSWNAAVIEEFRKRGGVVEEFKDRPLVILHTTGAKTGKERLNPLMHL